VIYAAESYKKIIPLTLEPRYNPHGWLRFHTSDGLRYDFSNDDNFEDSFKKLAQTLRIVLSESKTRKKLAVNVFSSEAKSCIHEPALYSLRSCLSLSITLPLVCRGVLNTRSEFYTLYILGQQIFQGKLGVCCNYHAIFSLNCVVLVQIS
jgi:hypothetical protein